VPGGSIETIVDFFAELAPDEEAAAEPLAVP
jgi:hypothetical protein